MRLRWVQQVTLGLIALAGLLASVQNLAATRQLGGLHADPVAEWEKRFEPLKQQLPFERGSVGYLSDSSIPGLGYDTANEQGEYILTQYVLSPIVIVKGADPEWIVGNFSRQAYEIWRKSNNAGFEVLPFKGNIYLIHQVP